MKKTIYAAILALFLMPVLAGCGETKGTPVSVNIKDGMTTTILETYQGRSVEQMLLEAEITFNEKDEITPSLSEALEEDGEIVISRYAHAQVIYDEEAPVDVELCGASVQDAIDQATVKVGKHDYVDVDTERLLEDGMIINITKRAAVTLIADGKKVKDITAAKTVQEYLDEKGVTLGKRDRISPKASKEIKEGTKIVIKRVKVKKVKETENIAYTTQYESSSSMYADQTSVKRNGSYGEREIVYKVTYVDGKEESRERVEETVIREPVDEIIVRGTKQRAPAGPTIVSKQYFDDCDGSGHGVCVITYSDGTIKEVPY